MDTKKCKYCQEEIAKNAKRCPKCGGKFGMPTWAKILIVLGVIFICIVGCVSSCSKAVNDAIDETFGGYDDQNGKTSFKVGEVFESKHIKMKFDSSNLNYTNYSQYATVNDGYKVVQFVFTAENIGEEDQMIDYTDFDCYSDNEKMQQFYSTDDAGLESGGTISKGKKVTVPVYCEVPISGSKIYVEFKPILAENHYEFVAQ